VVWPERTAGNQLRRVQTGGSSRSIVSPACAMRGGRATRRQLLRGQVDRISAVL